MLESRGMPTHKGNNPCPQTLICYQTSVAMKRRGRDYAWKSPQLPLDGTGRMGFLAKDRG